VLAVFANIVVLLYKWVVWRLTAHSIDKNTKVPFDATRNSTVGNELVASVLHQPPLLGLLKNEVARKEGIKKGITAGGINDHDQDINCDAAGHQQTLGAVSYGSGKVVKDERKEKNDDVVVTAAGGVMGENCITQHTSSEVTSPFVPMESAACNHEE
jgi:hypothetical protein